MRRFPARASLRTRCPARASSGCPMAGVVGSETATGAASKTCPVMGGKVPPMSCPVEDSEMDNRPMPFKVIVGQMGKTRLSGFVTATAVVGYVMSGGASIPAAAVLTVGTMLQSCSANTANQIIEVEHDKLMKRTCRRPLPTGQITKTGATLLSASELVVGTALLAAISPLAAGIGVTNWMIYVCMYTPLKRVSAVNTWFGSIVGGLPPLMGGAAATGVITGAAMSQCHLLAAFLLIWQIPHFMALSFHCRRDYEHAGYKMLAFYNPWRATFWTVFMSALMAILTLLGPTWAEMPVEGLWYYPVTAAANAMMLFKSWKFMADPVRHCRACFVFSYMYLGVMLIVFMVNHAAPVTKVQRVVERMTSTEAGASAASTAA
jgi:protoheme IX farnesyltransferase